MRGRKMLLPSEGQEAVAYAPARCPASMMTSRSPRIGCLPISPGGLRRADDCGQDVVEIVRYAAWRCGQVSPYAARRRADSQKGSALRFGLSGVRRRAPRESSRPLGRWRRRVEDRHSEVFREVGFKVFKLSGLRPCRTSTRRTRGTWSPWISLRPLSLPIPLSPLESTDSADSVASAESTNSAAFKGRPKGPRCRDGHDLSRTSRGLLDWRRRPSYSRRRW